MTALWTWRRPPRPPDDAPDVLSCLQAILHQLTAIEAQNRALLQALTAAGLQVTVVPRRLSIDPTQPPRRRTAADVTSRLRTPTAPTNPAISSVTNPAISAAEAVAPISGSPTPARPQPSSVATSSTPPSGSDRPPAA